MTLATISRAPAAAPQTGREARLAIRAGALKGQTAGLAPGFVQAVVLADLSLHPW